MVIIYFFYVFVLKGHLINKKPVTRSYCSSSTIATTKSTSFWWYSTFEPTKVKSFNMYSTNDGLEETKKQMSSRIPKKSTTRFPKIMPSYIVAFSFQETYDDIITAQQMICNKRSLQGSTNSVSPTASSKTLKLDRNSAHRFDDPERIDEKNEIKITIDEANDDKSDPVSAIDMPFDSKDTCIKLEADSCLTDDNMKESNAAIAGPIKCNNEHSLRMPKKKRCVRNKIKNINFKYKKAIKSEDRRSAAQLRDFIYKKSLSQVVSRSSLLKKSAIKENIVELEQTLSDESGFDKDSIKSSPSTIKKTSVSNCSQNTLRQRSESSTKTIKSNLDMHDSAIKETLRNELPYGKDIVNVSLAVTVPSHVKTSNDACHPSVAETIISTETLVYPSNMETSESTSSENSGNNSYLQYKELSSLSNKTLTLEKNQSNPNNIDKTSTFVVATTSSELGNLILTSDDMFAQANSEAFVYSENLRFRTPIFGTAEKEKILDNKTNLLDTVINMGVFPAVNATTSSAIYFNKNFDSVYVTGDSNKVSRNAKYKTKLDPKNVNSKCTLKKPLESDIEYNNNTKEINIPNESAIKSMIDEPDKYCSGEFDAYPKSINELWDRLVSVVDKAVKRLEDSLTEKIITEMRKSFTLIESNVNTLPQDEFSTSTSGRQVDKKIVSNKEVLVETELAQCRSLQCNLIGSHVIDNILLKLSIADPKSVFRRSSCRSLLKIKEPNILKDFFEVLKPPTDKPVVTETEKGDTTTLSTLTSDIEASYSFQSVKSLFLAPLSFVRENMLIIVSVPAFFVSFLVVYGVIVLLINPW